MAVYYTTALIAAILWNNVANCADNGVCYTPTAQLPNPDEFGGRSSMVQVMVGAPIRCAGKLTHWSFISTSRYVSGVTFFVWRPFIHKTGNVYFTSVGSFELAGETTIPPFSWVTVPSSPPISVQEGDVIGLYYDDWRLDDYFAFIPVSSPTRFFRRGGSSNLTIVDTLVAAKSRADLTYEMLSKGVIDMSDASKVRRQIALQAHVEFETSRALNKVRYGICQLPLDTGSCMALIPSFYYDAKLGECKPFVYSGCGGNSNRFHSAEQCLAVCQYVANLISSIEDQHSSFRNNNNHFATATTPRTKPTLSTSTFATSEWVLGFRYRHQQTAMTTPKSPVIYFGFRYPNEQDSNRLPTPTNCVDLFQTKQVCDRTVIQTRYFFNVVKNKCEPFLHFIKCVTSSNIFATKGECNFHCQILERDPSLLSKFRDHFHPVLGSKPRYIYES